jgi:membrane associated rhomboid family serine protease
LDTFSLRSGKTTREIYIEMSGGILEDIKGFYKKGGMTTKLLFINILVYLVTVLLYFLARAMQSAWLIEWSHGEFSLATTWYLPELIRRPWSPITHMFAHAGFWHIFFNMVFLYVLGGMFERCFGARKLLSTYLLGGLSGFVVYVFFYNLFPGLREEGISYALGASAAVMAILVGYATYFPDQEIRLILIGPVKLKYLAIVYVVIDYVSLGSGSNTGGHLGHLGGALFGFLLFSQIRQGRDIGAWFEKFLDWLVNKLRGVKGPKMRVVKSPSKTKSDAEFNAEKLARQKRMDQILDKISKGGYDSLTQSEKQFLDSFNRGS